MRYLMMLLHMLNMGVQVQICVCEAVWMVYKKKLVNLCDILYCSNVIFLQCDFEALNNVFSYSKTLRTECTKVHFVFLAQIKEPGERFLMV
jgi:hypothetical protein